MQILNQIQIGGLDNRELLKYSQLVGACARKWKNHFIALLPEIARRGVYKKKFESISEFAAKVGGIGRKTVEAVFQVEKYIADKPALKEVLPDVGINKVRAIATIATKENAEELARKVKIMSKAALEIYARGAKKQDSPPGRRNEREYLGFHVDKEVALEFRKFKQRLEKERKEKVDMNEVMKMLLGKIQEKPKTSNQSSKHSKKRTKTTRYATTEEKKQLQKYNGKCAYPDCNKPAKEIHHPERYELTKTHNNLKPMCKTHHELAHNGLIANEELEPNKWRLQTQQDRNTSKYQIDLKWLKYRLKSARGPIIYNFFQTVPSGKSSSSMP